MTALSCLQCERPVCVDCAVQGAVGIKCPDCARIGRAARGAVPVARMARAAITGIIAAAVIGAVAQAISVVPFIGLIVAAIGGAGIGEAVRWGSGGYRDPWLSLIAMVCAAIAFGFPLAVYLLRGGNSGMGIAFSIIAVLIAAVTARNRAQ